MSASPGLKAGRGLKQGPAQLLHIARQGIARPQGRARIETWASAKDSNSRIASPGLKAGRGLKLGIPEPAEGELVSIARPQGRARIETCARKPNPTRRPAHRPASRPGAD